MPLPEELTEELLAAMHGRMPDETQDSLRCLACLEDAYAVLAAYTGVEPLPDALLNAVVRLAVVLYNRMGNEGESSRREGDITRSFLILPEDIRAQARPWRRARTR